MSTKLYAPRLKDLEQRPLHLVFAEDHKCTHCGAPKHSMRLFYTEDEQTWLNVASAQPTSLVDGTGTEYMVLPCIHVNHTVVAKTSAFWTMTVGLREDGKVC